MSDTKKDTCEVICDFGDDFGTLTKENISTHFIDVHSSVSPLDPLNKHIPLDEAVRDEN